MSCVELRNEILRLNSLYRQGNPEVSDVEYDALVEQLRAMAPDDDFFRSGVAEKATDRMQPLPLPMFSLEKIKTYKEFLSWVNRMDKAGCKNLVITPKYDGISLLVSEFSQAAWTRGDGVQGQRSDAHFARMKNGEDSCEPMFEYTWGEAICSRSDFERVKGEYKNARNMVAGLFNSPMGANTEQIRAVTFVRYGLDLEEDKARQLDYLEKHYLYVTPYKLMKLKDVLSYGENSVLDMLNSLYQLWKQTYQIDGLVIEVDENSVRKALGRKPNGNPDYAVAFKREEWLQSYTTTVERVEWNVSKDGCLCPVVCVKPVEMEGATVSRVTGYNARYIVDNHIAGGSVIDIIRSGDVIPKHIRTLGYSEKVCEEELPNMCPCCGKPVQWDSTRTELVCVNENCKQQVISRMVYFFRTMGCEGFDEPIVRRLYDAGMDSIRLVVASRSLAFMHALGENKGLAVYNEIWNKVLNTKNPVARLMTAYNVFGGVLAEKTAQNIIDGSEAVQYLLRFGINQPMRDEDVLAVLRAELCSIPGVGAITADTFITGMNKFLDMRCLYPYYTCTPKKILVDNCMYVCMTGFRDKELENELIKQGHEVLGGVTAKCTVLVVADLNSTSSKMQKAQKMGIRIVDRKTFEDEIYRNENK